ncbi:MAG: glycosyltransferase family A protein [Bacteroidales bacterium]
MKSVAVIPVHGRLAIISYTIRRLLEINKFDHVICVGGEQEKTICEKAGAEFHIHPNKPLGRKLNFGFEKAREHKPDIVSYIGSTNWLSPSWLSVLSPLLRDAWMVGKPDFNIVKIEGEEYDMIRWLHYPRQKMKLRHYLLSKGEREFIKAGGRMNEPVGIGRLLRSDFLDKIDWKPFDENKNRNMDSEMMYQIASNQGTYSLCRDNKAQSLKIASSSWESLNSYDMYLLMPTVKEIITPIEFLLVWFPDALKLKL